MNRSKRNWIGVAILVGLLGLWITKFPSVKEQRPAISRASTKPQITTELAETERVTGSNSLAAATTRMVVLTVDVPHYYDSSKPVHMPLPAGTPFDALPAKKADYLRGYKWGYLDSVNIRWVCRSNFSLESPETQEGWKAGYDAGSRSVHRL